MNPRIIHVALLMLAGAGLVLSAPVAIAAIGGLVAYEALRSRTEWAAIEKLAKDSAAALLKQEGRLNALERGVKALVE